MVTRLAQPHARLVRSLLAGALLLVGCLQLQAEDHAPRLRFSVKGGVAEDTLTEMALQANLLIGFNDEAVRGVRTNPVRGWFTVREALALMLEGTALVAVPDAPGTSYAIRVREWEGVVKLPPYIVEDDKGTPWLYARLDDIEVLSRCSPELTANLIDRHRRLLAMLDLLYPAKFWPQRDVPTLLVLNEAELQTQATRELTEAIRRRITTDSIATQILFMPNFHFYDADSQVIYFLLEGVDMDRSAVTVTPWPSISLSIEESSGVTPLRAITISFSAASMAASRTILRSSSVHDSHTCLFTTKISGSAT